MASARELMEIYQKLARDYPLAFWEDAFQEDDLAGLLKLLPHCQIVGDDLFASHPQRIREGIAHRAANTVLLKINQTGAVSQAICPPSWPARAVWR